MKNKYWTKLRRKKLLALAGYRAPPIDGQCELCRRLRKLVPDHDHQTNRFRGWLCVGCNTGLGRLGDNEAGLERGLIYLRRGLKS